MKKILTTLFLAATTACVSATVAEPSACTSQQVSWAPPTIPALPPGVDCTTLSAYAATPPPVSTSTQVDFSGTLQKVSDVADAVNVAVNQLLVTPSTPEELQWVQRVTVTVTASNMPAAELASYVRQDTSDVMQFNVEMSSDQVFSYLSSGLVTLTFTLQASSINACQAEAIASSNQLSATANVCVSASGSFSKHL